MASNPDEKVESTAVNRSCAQSLAALAAFVRPHVPENRHQCIAELAFASAERRGFAPGHELDDWLEAEREVDARRIGECYPF
jgi:hypothetical protein